jgi:methanogenic corrinoid protein MtbC1
MATKAESKLLSIGDIRAETGLTVDVVRVWERRYGFPVPARTPSGHRRYHADDLRRLRLMAEAVAHGHRPALVARSDEATLKRMILPNGNERVEGLFEAALRMDSDQMRSLLHRYLGQLGWRLFLLQVVSPLIDRVSIAWADGSIEAHHEHLISEVLEDFLRKLRQEFHIVPGHGRVLLCTMPGERHRLDLLMAALAYAAQGARTELLGVDLPIVSIAQAARILKVDRVAVSLSIQCTGEPTRRMLQELKNRLPPDCRLLVGGKGATRTRRIQGVGRMLELNA